MPRFIRFAVALCVWVSSSPSVAADVVLLTDNFDYPNGVITNEFAFWSPTAAGARHNPIWEVNSGSLFASGGTGWTGVPDGIGPNATSSNGNNSAIFRLDTKRSDFGDVAVSFSLLNQGLKTSPVTPATDWDGLHIWLRYQSEAHLYYTSINRRDNKVVIKKKTPGGPSNGGTYYNLSSFLPFNVPYNAWQQVRATAKNNADGSVTIQLFSGNTLLVSAVDNGTIGGPPIRAAGKVGIRGDNANLKFDNFVVTTAGAPAPPPIPVPNSLTATPGDGRVTLAWNGILGARSYNLYRSQSLPVTKSNGVKIANVTTPHTHTGLTNGTTYHLCVTAVFDAGESAESATVSAAPRGPVTAPPTASIIPKGVTVTPGDSFITIGWLPVAGATSYNLYRTRFAPANKATGYKVINVKSPYVNTGFINGTTYYMVVTAVVNGVESAESAQVSTYPRRIPPAIPTGVAALPGNTMVAITWPSVPGATSYNLYRSRFGGVTKINGYKISNVRSPHINTGFLNGTTYYMVLTAVNAAGESLESVQVSAVPRTGASSFAFPSAASGPGFPDLESVKAFPSPWKSNQHRGLNITFDQMTAQATVKIFTVAGEWVKTLPTSDLTTTWDLTNDGGQRVASGLYIYLITNEAGQKKRGVLTVVQ